MPADIARDEPPEDARPWERPGAVRRDCASHRGNLLAWVGMAAMLGSSLVPGLGLILLPVSISIMVAARGDLAQMEAGVMQPTGRARTREALEYAVTAVVATFVNTASVAAVAGTVVWLCRS